MRDTIGPNSCVYIALDMLLGNRWDEEGRKFCAEIIREHNGYCSSWNYIIPEFAPVIVWSDNFSYSYNQPDTYVVINRGGWKYRVAADTSVVYTYRRDNGTAHAACMPLSTTLEIQADGIALIWDKGRTTFIKTRT